MPDVEMLSLLSREFGVSMNELISGERLAAEDFQKAADNNLAAALDNSTFTLKEKIIFFKKNGCGNILRRSFCAPRRGSVL